MFTPVETTLGALLMHRTTSLLLFNNGKLLGASGIIRRSITQPTLPDLSVIAGMVFGVATIALFAPAMLPEYPSWSLTFTPVLATIAAGFFTGWGTKIGAGCTSGHMLCGLSRLSPRSFIATATFFTTAVITSNILRPLPMLEKCLSPITGEAVPCYSPAYPSTAAVSTLATIVTAGLFISLLPSYFSSKPLARALTSFISGALFALALLITGMASPQRVLQFFSFLPGRTENFDPSLALIILFGLLPSVVYNLVRGFDKPPALESQFSFPRKTGWRDWDWRFLLGHFVFGICWGATGVCPGPGIVRSILQPTWGCVWLLSFWAGSVVRI